MKGWDAYRMAERVGVITQPFFGKLFMIVVE